MHTEPASVQVPSVAKRIETGWKGLLTNERPIGNRVEFDGTRAGGNCGQFVRASSGDGIEQTF